MEFKNEAVIDFNESDFSSQWGYALLWNGRVEKDPTFPWVLLNENLAHIKSSQTEK